MDYSALSFSELLKFKNNKLIIWKGCDHDDKIYTYEDVINESQKLTAILREINVTPGRKIGLMIDHSPQIIALILSILNHCCSFCPVSLQIKLKDLTDCLQRYGSNYLFHDSLINEDLIGLKLVRKVKVFEKSLYIYVAQWEIPTTHKRLPLCYSIQTSGSTSEPKIVHVPYRCIVPNIENLSKKFEITSQDVIFVTSPPTFDPFVIDIFLALKNGSSLLMVPKQTRCSPNLLCKLIFTNDGIGATIIQMTPSVFKLFSSETIENVIFCNNSSLRILVLGGEPFPSLNEVKPWVDLSSKNGKRIFNLYGITEVSCWSSIDEITTETTEITLGVPIDDSTILEVRDSMTSEVVSQGDGQLFIGSSTRKCLINNEDPEVLLNEDLLFRSTGDHVYINDKKIFYKGRVDDVVKRFGHRTSLSTIECAARKCENVSDACCVFWGNKNLLVLFYTGTSIRKDVMYQSLRKNLQNHEIPDDILHLHVLPLSSHGKLSKLKLLDWYKSNVFQKDISESPLKEFKVFISTILGKCDNEVKTDEPSRKMSRLSWDCSFISAGGTSFQAVQLCDHLAKLTESSNGEILRMLLDENCPLSDVLKLVETVERCTHPIDSASKISDMFALNISWKFDLGKCVDSNPTINKIDGEKSVVSIGSHSHLLVNLTAKTGERLSSLTLPDRIEGQVEPLSDGYGVVGCYDGCLYKYEIGTGQLIWTFNSHGMIKCKPLFVDSKIIFGNYAKGNNLFCLNEESELLWDLKVGTKGIYSSPVKFDRDKVIISSLDGTVLLLNINSVDIIWKKNLGSPIFSTCAILCGSRLLVAEVTGIVHCFNADGSEAFSYKTNGPIFSSFVIIQYDNGFEFALFGCHDRNLYCLEITADKMCLKWKTSLQAQIFSTPKWIKINERFLIISCSTNGFVNVIDLESGSVLADIKLEGEVFSSPAVDGNAIFVGCRDNNLYCISVDIAEVRNKDC